jgi:hypothetical protein
MSIARKLLMIPIVVVAALAGIVATTSPAQAGGPAGNDLVGQLVVQEVGMMLNCADMPDDALEYAVDHNLCTPDRQNVRGGAGTQDVRVGDCGISHLFVLDQAGTSGWMVAGYGFQSILGPAIHRNLTIGWTNVSFGTVGGSNDSGGMLSPTYGSTRPIFTDNGRVFATLTGTIRLVWGGQCVLLVPADTTTILPG